MIPWVGENSAYLGGKQAHGVGCRYRTRDDESAHSLKRRYAPDDETKARLEGKQVAKRLKLEAKKMRRAVEMGGEDEDASSQ